MKRYSQYEGNTYVMEDDPMGEWVKHSSAEGLIDELYETINRNASKIIKLEEQNKEMLEVLKKVQEGLIHQNDIRALRLGGIVTDIIQKAERGEE